MRPAVYQIGLWRAAYLQPNCCACGLPFKVMERSQFLPVAKFVCHRCHDAVNWLPSPQTLDIGNVSLTSHKIEEAELYPKIIIDVQAATYYSGYVRGALIAFKYQENLAALPILVYAIQQLPRPKGCYYENSVILAVPTTDHRLNQRGFDPLAILAYHLSKHWKIPLWTGVSRIDDTISQQGLNRQERLTNIRHAFQVNVSPPTTKILLFDDVITTGSTLKELARTLITDFPQLQLMAYALVQAKTT